ncbi:glycosyltransferase family 25 protein [Hypoxylon crocopeplum]|nr:glycosyltransferase family 25 protein [Hypoxylon crocopeplum]
MAFLMSARRPSNPVIIAISAVVLLSLYLLSTRGGNVPYFNTERATSSLTNDIYNNTFGFEKVFVIGLPSRTDRRDGMVLGAALSNLEIEFIDGVDGKDVPDKALPTSPDQNRMPDPVVGSWRAHINAIQEVVRRNLSSALIMEDDADWDVRIRSQLHDFALASHALTQPLAGSSAGSPRYADATYPEAKNGPSAVPDLAFDNLPATAPPKTSPYGDNWDVLWLGQCGMRFPFADNKVIPKGRVVQAADATVPQKQHLWTISSPDDLAEQYADHARVVHHVQDGVCSLAYGVTQKGARQLLHELGLKAMDAAFDIQLRWFCEGTGRPSRGYHNCLTVQPSLFQIHLPAGPKKSNSDISDHGDGFQDEMTRVLRYSVRMNAEALMEGRTDDLVDQWPDN